MNSILCQYLFSAILTVEVFRLRNGKLITHHDIGEVFLRSQHIPIFLTIRIQWLKFRSSLLLEDYWIVKFPLKTCSAIPLTKPSSNSSLFQVL